MRDFRPVCETNLTEKWMPALDIEFREKLSADTRVADIGCGHGISTQIVAKPFSKISILRIDSQPTSVEATNRHSKEQKIENTLKHRTHLRLL